MDGTYTATEQLDDFKRLIDDLVEVANDPADLLLVWLLSRGWTKKEIGRAFGLSRSWVRWRVMYLRANLAKLRGDPTELVRLRTTHRRSQAASRERDRAKKKARGGAAE